MKSVKLSQRISPLKQVCYCALLWLSKGLSFSQNSLVFRSILKRLQLQAALLPNLKLHSGKMFNSVHV